MTQFIEINELYSMQLSIRHNSKKSYFECPFIATFYMVCFFFKFALLCCSNSKNYQRIVLFFYSLRKCNSLWQVYRMMLFGGFKRQLYVFTDLQHQTLFMPYIRLGQFVDYSLISLCLSNIGCVFHSQ